MVKAAQPRGARRRLDAAPARADVGADPHAVHVADGVLQRRAAAEQKRLGAQALPQGRESLAVSFGVRQAAVVRIARRRPQQEIDLEVVVTPLLHDTPRQVE